MVNLNINIEKKHIFLIVAVSVFLAGIILTFALQAGEVPNPGHSPEQLGAPAGCAMGDALTWDGDSWGCEGVCFSDGDHCDTIDSGTSGVQCLSAVYDSYSSGGVVTKDTYVFDLSEDPITIACFNGVQGCTIIQKIYDHTSSSTNNPKKIRSYSYIQTGPTDSLSNPPYSSDTAPKSWTSSYRPTSTFLNGGTGDAKNIVPRYPQDGDSNNKYLRVYDDNPNGNPVNDEKDISNIYWTFIDDSVQYGMIVDICSTPSEN
ncbi:hypothetical protein HYW76_01575 [Candidatus Pacearchaeota archaeon]|nr:hypothetical protein [Candidatus Pacearchaeota archaeon]